MALKATPLRDFARHARRDDARFRDDIDAGLQDALFQQLQLEAQEHAFQQATRSSVSSSSAHPASFRPPSQSLDQQPQAGSIRPLLGPRRRRPLRAPPQRSRPASRTSWADNVLGPAPSDQVDEVQRAAQDIASTADENLANTGFMSLINQLSTGQARVVNGELIHEPSPSEAHPPAPADPNPADAQAEVDRLAQEWAREFNSDWIDDSNVQPALLRPVETGPPRMQAFVQRTPLLSRLHAAPYTFDAANPFHPPTSGVQDGRSADELIAAGQEALREGALVDAILLFEAAVQVNPRHALGWQLLGSSRAENEQEEQAISALERSLQLEPDRREAWLALATSLTNEMRYQQAVEALQQSLLADPRYAALSSVPVPSLPTPDDEYMTIGTLDLNGLFEQTLEMYMQAVAMGTEVDPDVQIGIGVLFHMKQEYSKAVDCFQAALDVRPDDFLLWNKLGATLANSNRSAEALNIYKRALELRPGYVRARYNAGVACINLRLYHDAAAHFLAALALQQGGADETREAMSDTIWTTLRMALMMQEEYKLAELIEQRDVELFRAHYDF
eukprot:TRINITY_DN8837_c0_g1_i6.p1 TRINITY_DN8837_c0_g1~~TRINITY_DN8837_c0_g1_i6.p1  ORF type:complete len:562 (+),score=100.96 TRINITY_DN8837_c0_g1_i6:47-1732(+)